MISNNLYSLILGSQSPRRKELLGWLGVPFEICIADIEEVSDKLTPVEIAEDIAALKGRTVIDRLQARVEKDKSFNPFVVSSDTIVTLGDKIFGKPTDVNDARDMLKELAGRTHQVITSVFMGFVDHSGKKVEDVFSIETAVTFKSIDNDVLEHYLESGESLDKAGSYGIQGQGLVFVSEIDGSYSNVVGFPLNAFHARLKKVLGFENDADGAWRKAFLSQNE
jgi:septum formation protein